MTGQLLARPPCAPTPGAVLLPGWLDEAAQRRLAEACDGWARDAGGLRSPRMPTGGTMSVQMTCLGWHWVPYRYSRTVDDGDGRPVPPLPAWLEEWSVEAVGGARRVDPQVDGGARGPYAPDVALVNWYGPATRMGMHVDRDERSDAPVVSFSVGDPCVFRWGSPEGRGRPWQDLVLESGDVFVFGGPSRRAYHGVPRLRPGTGPPLPGWGHGRLNVTVRQSGLERSS